MRARNSFSSLRLRIRTLYDVCNMRISVVYRGGRATTSTVNRRARSFLKTPGEMGHPPPSFLPSFSREGRGAKKRLSCLLQLALVSPFFASLDETAKLLFFQRVYTYSPSCIYLRYISEAESPDCAEMARKIRTKRGKRGRTK